MRSCVFLLYVYAALLVFFLLGKVVFLLCAGSDFTLADTLQVLANGLKMDLSTTSYLIVVPILTVLASVAWQRMPVRRILTPYYIAISMLISAIWVGDLGLYPFWGFKIDATIFNYIDSPGEALASVSTGFVLLHCLLFLAVASALAYLLYRVTPKKVDSGAGRSRITLAVILLLAGALQPIVMRGGLGESTMNVGQAYFCQRQILNHAAVNPTFSLLYSISKNQNLGEQYRMLDAKECAQLFDGLYAQQPSRPGQQEDSLVEHSDTLLNNKRPNILFVVVEGMGDMFYPEGGAPKAVTPNLQRWSEESVWFTQYYNNSFRTDRGLLSLLSGTIGFPSISIMKMPIQSQLMPSIAHSLQAVGYHTSFWYGGDLNFTNMHGYLTCTGYEETYSKDDFSLREQRSGGKWGVTDSILIDRVWQELQQQKVPFFTTVLTLSSHEPFEVPYDRLKDNIYNAFAYTDHELGRLLTRLKSSALWDDLLVVIVPDHGFTYGNMEENEERFFKARMLWTGGAIRTAGKKVGTLMNQSDVAATLLGQMGISHEDFPWSRDVLSAAYKYPFAYSTFVDGFLFKDSTGTTIYDNIGRKSIIEIPSPNDKRMQRGMSILQSSYDWLEELKTRKKGE